MVVVVLAAVVGRCSGNATLSNINFNVFCSVYFWKRPLLPAQSKYILFIFPLVKRTITFNSSKVLPHGYCSHTHTECVQCLAGISWETHFFTFIAMAHHKSIVLAVCLLERFFFFFFFSILNKFLATFHHHCLLLFLAQFKKNKHNLFAIVFNSIF